MQSLNKRQILSARYDTLRHQHQNKQHQLLTYNNKIDAQKYVIFVVEPLRSGDPPPPPLLVDHIFLSFVR